MYTQIAIKQTSTEQMTMPRPTLFPMTLRSTLAEEMFESGINSTSKKKQPGTQGEQNPQTKINQRRRPKVDFNFRPDKNPSHDQDADHSDGNTKHP
jgi:hypothetical protein